MRFNPNLAAVALEQLSRFEKDAIVPADASGVMPVEAGGPPGMPPGMPPGAPPGAMLDGPAPAAGAPPLPPEADASGSPMPPPGGGDPGEQLASINSKLDQLIGTLNGFLLGQQAGGGKGGGGGSKDQTAALVQQIAQQMGIQTGMDPAAGGMGMPPAPTGTGVSVLPGMPGTPGAGADSIGGNGVGAGMSVSASDTSKRASPADQVGRVIKNLRR